MATKYDVLAKLIERDAESHNLDKAGNYYLLLGVVDLISRPWESEDALNDAIYDLIADGVAGQSKADARNAPMPSAPVAVRRSVDDGPNLATIGF